MIKKNFYTLTILFACFTLFFSIARIVFLFYYWEFFNEFPIAEILLSLISGIRFDLVIITKTIGLLCFISFLLGNWSHSKFFEFLVFFVSLLVIIFFISIFVVDLGYYHIIKRHISFEVALVFYDLPGAIRQALSGYKILIVLYLIFTLLLTICWFRFWKRIRSIPDVKQGFFKHLLTIPTIFILLIILGRGGLQSRPTDENFAFRNQHVQLANLTLNAPYTVATAFMRDRIKKMTDIDEKTAVESVRKLVSLPDDRFIDDEFPLLRQSFSSSRYTNPLSNIVIIIMEGVPALWTGIYNPSKVSQTPNIDQIASKSLMFTQHFSTGVYTIQGFAALIASIPSLPSINLITSPFVQNNLLSIPRLLKKSNYDTLFLSGYFEGSASIDSFMRSMGIDKIMNQNDFDNFEDISHGWGVYDEYVFERFFQEIKQLKPPYLAIVEPCTTHSPHKIPDKKWQYYKDKSRYTKWKNVLRYSDGSIGEFFKKAATLDSFKNTLYIITSDHISETNPDHYADSARLPLIFYTPGGQIPPGINDVTSSQTDLLPTIMDYLKLDEIHASTGRSILAQEPGKGVSLYYNGSFILWFEGDTVTRYTNMKPDGHFNFKKDKTNRKNLLETTDMTTINNNFLSYLQLIKNGLIDNKIYR